MTAQLQTITPQTIQPIFFKSYPVITTRLLADVYGTDPVRIRQDFNRNKDRFTEGKHFFLLEWHDLKALKDDVSLRYAANGDVKTSHVVPRTINKLTLWTERGAVRHAKMLDTSQAWEVFEQLEEFYFDKYTNPTPQQLQPCTITHAQQRAIQKLVCERVFSVNSGQKGFAQLYGGIKDRYQVPSYKDIPSDKFDECVKFINNFPLTCGVRKLAYVETITTANKQCVKPIVKELENGIIAIMAAERLLSVFIAKASEGEEVDYFTFDGLSKAIGATAQSMSHSLDSMRKALG